MRGRPIWFGGKDRSEASLAQFYAWLGAKKSARVRLAVMDMWKPFRLATRAHAPKSAILFDKFHIMRHLGEALDTVRKSEYARLAGRDRRYIKGQKYTVLSRRENLTLDGKGVAVSYLRNSGTGDAIGMGFVGADGLWSVARVCLGERSRPQSARRTAWRALVPAEAVPAEFREPVVNLSIGPEAHIVHYPARAGEAINIVAIAADAWEGIGWSTRSDRDELLTRFSETDWAHPVRALLAEPDRWLKWALYDRPPLYRWGRGAATLLGDAAHPMLPFLAQGAAMAIEDAAVLADALVHVTGGTAAAMRHYENQRRRRTARVQAAARTNGRMY